VAYDVTLSYSCSSEFEFLGKSRFEQWRTDEGVSGLEPLPLAYDLRNKRFRMRQNMVLPTKNIKKLSGARERAQTLSRPFLQWGGAYPFPRRTLLGALPF